PLHRPLKGALEVTERLRTGLTDAGIFVAGRDNVFLAARLDAGERQFLAEDLGHFLHRQFDFEDVPAGLVAGAGTFPRLSGSERRTDIAVPLPGAARAFLAVAKLGDFDLRQGDRDEVLPLLPNHLAA